MSELSDGRRRRSGARVPPHNLDAEASLLGALLLSKDALTAVAETGINAADFYKPAHQHVYEAVRVLASAGEPVDALAASLGCELLARAAAETPASFRSLALVSPTGLSGRTPRRGAPGSPRFLPWNTNRSILHWLLAHLTAARLESAPPRPRPSRSPKFFR